MTYGDGIGSALFWWLGVATAGYCIFYTALPALAALQRQWKRAKASVEVESIERQFMQ